MVVSSRFMNLNRSRVLEFVGRQGSPCDWLGTVGTCGKLHELRS